MKYKRASGIILHPSSLPGPDGIGDLGPEAYNWINFLADAGCGLWQVLPLSPTGYGDSPYQCFSAFAGNPYLVNPALLLEDGLLEFADLNDLPEFSVEQVDFGEVIPWKLLVLDRAFNRFQKNPPRKLQKEYADFVLHHSFWLPEFALFMAIKEEYGGGSWENWPKPMLHHEKVALNQFSNEHELSIQKHTFRQFLFFRQWNNLRAFAHQKQVQIIGDVPIFVSFDSADAWSHNELFFMDKNGLPAAVAGVPPDYFSPTGQLWGNPLYQWNMHQETNYSWWIERIKSALEMVDILRLDHFRGFAGYWEVPAGMQTAEIGDWKKGPGEAFFNVLHNAIGNLPIIAEDLGEITPDVNLLRDQFDFPGMKIFQFAFTDDADNLFLPHNYVQNCVAYVGSHDNDTACGWFQSAPEKERDFIRRYLARSGEDISWDMIRAVWASVAVMALAPIQDFLSLGTEARMNFPGQPSGNWTWRMPAGALNTTLAHRIRENNVLYNRLSGERLEKSPKKPLY